MGRFLKYLTQVLRHKWFTFLECRKLGIPWLGIIHDWSKFLPAEFFSYANWFYGPAAFLALENPHAFANGDTICAWENGDPHFSYVVRVTDQGVWIRNRAERDAFNAGWNSHQKRNKHHWQYWLLIEDDSGTMDPCRLPIPERYLKEMLADWRGAGRAYGNPDTKGWYLGHWKRMGLHHEAREWIEEQLGV